MTKVDALEILHNKKYALRAIALYLKVTFLDGSFGILVQC